MNFKWLFLLIALASTATNAQDMQQLFYYLKITTHNVEVSCFVNGFPVYDMNESGELTNQLPVNLALIGKNNELKIIAKPLGEGASVQGGIAPYAGGDVVSSDDDKAGVLRVDFEVDEQTTKVFTFDNERFDFSDQLVDVPVIKDEEQVKEYALSLLKMIEKKKTNELVEEMMPKIEATATAFSVDKSIMIDNMKNVLSESIFKLPVEQLKKDEIVAVPYCDGKVWELSSVSGHPLIYAEEEGGSMSMSIYVAEIGGKLRVIR